MQIKRNYLVSIVLICITVFAVVFIYLDQREKYFSQTFSIEEVLSNPDKFSGEYITVQGCFYSRSEKVNIVSSDQDFINNFPDTQYMAYLSYCWKDLEIRDAIYLEIVDFDGDLTSIPGLSGYELAREIMEAYSGQEVTVHGSFNKHMYEVNLPDTVDFLIMQVIQVIDPVLSEPRPEKAD